MIFFGVGRVDEDETECGVGGIVFAGDFFERAEGVVREDLRAIGDCEGFEITADQDGGWRVIFYEEDFGCAAA